MAYNTYNTTTNVMEEDGHPFPQVSNVKQHDVSCQIVHGEGSTILVTHVWWHLVDIFGGYQHQFTPGAVVTECNHSVTDLENT